jgi:phosphate transport system protein
VDSAQVELDEKIVELLARQSPVASDLRLLVGALRMSSSLERMGDLAAHVAVVARARYPESAVPEAHREDLGTLSELAREASTDTIEVIADRDLARGALVERRDEELDELHSAIYRAVARTEGYSAAQVMDLTLLPRFYERFGDHAVSVVRRVGFLVTGDSLDSRESVGDDF